MRTTTERKPGNVPFESWVDRQIREATERGEFDDLPDRGKPLPGLDRPYDENWWLKDLMRREGISGEVVLPPSLRLRKEVERLPDAVRGLRTEAKVRAAVADLNRRIAEAVRAGTGSGPRVHVGLVDAERIVEGWRRGR